MLFFSRKNTLWDLEVAEHWVDNLLSTDSGQSSLHGAYDLCINLRLFEMKVKSKGISMNALAKRIPDLRGQPRSPRTRGASAPSWSGFKVISEPQLFLCRTR